MCERPVVKAGRGIRPRSRARRADCEDRSTLDTAICDLSIQSKHTTQMRCKADLLPRRRERTSTGREIQEHKVRANLSGEDVDNTYLSTHLKLNATPSAAVRPQFIRHFNSPQRQRRAPEIQRHQQLCVVILRLMHARQAHPRTARQLFR